MAKLNGWIRIILMTMNFQLILSGEVNPLTILVNKIDCNTNSVQKAYCFYSNIEYRLVSSTLVAYIFGDSLKTIETYMCNLNSLR